MNKRHFYILIALLACKSSTNTFTIDEQAPINKPLLATNAAFASAVCFYNIINAAIYANLCVPFHPWDSRPNYLQPSFSQQYACDSSNQFQILITEHSNRVKYSACDFISDEVVNKKICGFLGRMGIYPHSIRKYRNRSTGVAFIAGAAALWNIKELYKNRE